MPAVYNLEKQTAQISTKINMLSCLSNDNISCKCTECLRVKIIIIFSYITTIEENCDEGTRLKFEGGLDKVEDLDKVRLGSM